MIIELDEVKAYLRVDHDDDDALISRFINMAELICNDTLRVTDYEVTDTVRVAVLFIVAYLYEHREDSDMNELTRNVRYILATEREAAF